MSRSMQALRLDAQWRPRAGSAIGAAEATTRKAVRASAVWHSPELAIGSVPVPRVADGEVLVRVRACGVCGTDVHCASADPDGYVGFSGTARLPVTLGHEFAGEVVEVGRGVTSLAVGDAVAVESVLWCGVCEQCRGGNPNQCRSVEMLGLTVAGAFAEYVAVSERFCWKLDALRSAFSDDGDRFDAGALIEPLGCAYNGIFVVGGGFRPGAYVAIHGAGPIGLSAVLLARLAGAARIIVLEPSGPRAALAEELGADHVASPDDLRAAGTSPAAFVRDLTGGQGADFHVEASGAARQTLPEIGRSIAPNGTVVYLGRLDPTAPLFLDAMVSQANRIVGARGHAGHGIYPAIIRLLASGRLPAQRMISARYPLGGAIEAIGRAAARTDGKIIVRVP